MLRAIGRHDPWSTHDEKMRHNTIRMRAARQRLTTVVRVATDTRKERGRMGLSLALHSHNKHTSLHIDCRNQVTVKWVLEIALDGDTDHEPA